MRKRVEATLAVFLILSCVGLRLAYTEHRMPPEEGVDLITIDSIAPLDTLQRPPVRFPHGIHAAATDDTTGCLACHDPAPGAGQGITFSLKNRREFSGEALQDLYHEQCIGCHADREKSGLSTGPQVCSGCHEKPAPDPSPMSHNVDFNARLHLRHTDGAALDCQVCHERLAPGDDAHGLCVTCHLGTPSAESGDAPLTCTGCHAFPVPEGEDPGAFHGGEVDFDHDLHEGADISCEVCHHKEPDTGCAECHPRRGDSEGGEVTLQAAMHSRTADRSCVGCHEAMGAGAVDDCTGCHAPFGKGSE